MPINNLPENEGLTPKIIYYPEYEENSIEKFTKFVQARTGMTFENYWELHEWSYRNYPEFWDCVWHYFEIVHSQPYDEVFDRTGSSFDNMQWFRGARLNFAENVFKYRDSKVAIIATDATDHEEHLTYRQMYEEVCLYAKSLRNAGIKNGDVVACYITNKKEAVLAFLATASLGAIWSGSLPLLGVTATIQRFQQISPKIIFTSGDFVLEGKEIKMLEKIPNVVKSLPFVEKVVFVPSERPGVIEDISHIPKCCFLSEFLKNARSEYKSNPWELEFEQVPFDFPLHISFTSGTTGSPKGVIHSHGIFETGHTLSFLIIANER